MSQLSRPDRPLPSHGAQRRGWEERSHAQHREHGEHRTFPASEHRGRGDARSGRESRLIDRTGKLSLDVTDLNRASPPPQTVMHFYSGPPKQFLSGVDNDPLISAIGWVSE